MATQMKIEKVQVVLAISFRYACDFVSAFGNFPLYFYLMFLICFIPNVCLCFLYTAFFSLLDFHTIEMRRKCAKYAQVSIFIY